MNRLQGKVAVITGGNSGIGLATAKLFAREGATVIITGRDQATLDRAATEIGHGAVALRVDAANVTEVDALFEQVRQRFGGLDILFANAGVFKLAPLADSTEQLYHELFDINVKGVFFAIQKAEPIMRDGGSIVINASTVSHVGTPGASIYTATKAAVRQFARNLSMELGGRSIRVNAVSPGITRTALLERLGYDAEQAEGAFAHLAKEVPVRRPGNPDEIAKAVLFLASDDSSYVVGEEILVDGGYSTIGIPGVAR